MPMTKFTIFIEKLFREIETKRVLCTPFTSGVESMIPHVACGNWLTIRMDLGCVMYSVLWIRDKMQSMWWHAQHTVYDRTNPAWSIRLWCFTCRMFFTHFGPINDSYVMSSNVLHSSNADLLCISRDLLLLFQAKFTPYVNLNNL